jgi:hypothetical protein
MFSDHFHSRWKGGRIVIVVWSGVVCAVLFMLSFAVDSVPLRIALEFVGIIAAGGAAPGLRAAMADGDSRTVSGTLSGENQVAKLIEINNRHFDLRAEGNLLVVAYADRPGVMGTVGALLGQEQINIEAAQISQELDGRASIMVLRVDRVPDQDLLDRIGDVVEASAIRGIAAT